MKTIKQGQSFLDVVIETTGDLDNAFEMSLLNGISVTDDLQIGQILGATPITNIRVTNTFNENNKPATEITQKEFDAKKMGIDYMIIQTNFIIA